MTNFCHRLVFGLLLAFSIALPACSKSNGLDDNTMTANITSYNHTPEYIHQFYVDGAWGGNSFAYGGGGKFGCCIVYPRVWRPGLTATVKWTTSSSDPKATGDDIVGKWHEKVVAIEEYKKPAGTLSVHFLANGQVRLIISDWVAGYPDYPGPPAPVKPDDFPFQR